MMAYLTRPPQQEASVERLGMMAGGLPKIKQMIDFILKNADKVSTVGGKISREFLEFMAEKNPQNIKNVYLDVVKRLGIGVDVGKAPKTDLKKVKSKVEADKRITQELADEGQIEVNEETASDMTEFMKKNDPEGFQKIQKIVDDINNKNTPVKSPYKFTGDETLDDLYKLEEEGIISRSDYNVYGERYLDYVDAQVAKRFGYTEQEVNKMPIGRLNVLRAKANPNWAEANYGDDYMRILEKERAAEVEAGVYDDPEMFDNMFNKMQEEMDDYIPGEKPLTKNKRTLNAGGGLIGGGMIEGEDLGSRTGFAEPLPTNIQNWLKETFPDINLDFSLGRYGLSREKNKTLYQKVYTAASNKLKNKEYVYTPVGTDLENLEYKKGYGTGKQLLAKAKEKGIYISDKTQAAVFADNFKIPSEKNPIKGSTNKIFDLSVLDEDAFVEKIQRAQVSAGRATPEATEKFLSKDIKKAKKRKTQLKRDRAEKKQGGVKTSFTGTAGVEKGHMNDLFSQYITGQNLGYVPKDINKEIGKKGGIDDKMRSLYKKRERLLKQKPKNLKKELENINIKGARLAGQSRGFKTFTIMDPVSQKTHEFGGKRFQLDPTNQFPGMTEREIVDFIKNADPNDFDAQLKIKMFEDNRQAVFNAVKKQQKPLTKSFFNPNQLNMGFGFLDDVTTKIMDDVAKGAVKYGPDVIRGAGTAAKIGAVETGFGLPFLRLEEYLGTRPKDAMYNAPTLSMYEYFKNRAGGPRRQAFAQRQGLGEEYISATEKMKDAVRKFGGVKNEAEILPLMENAGIGLTDKEKEAYFQIGGSEFDKYEQFRAERQAAEYAKIRGELPEIFTETDDPFAKLIGIPATVMAKSYFGEQEAPPAYDFANGGRVGMKIGGDPKDKKKTTPALDKPTIPIDPNAPIDPGRRDFMEKGAGMGLGLGALTTGLVKFGPEIKKAVTNVTSQFDELPKIINELYFTIRNRGESVEYGRDGLVTTKLGPYKLEEGPGGYNITKTTDGDYRYQEEYFEVQTDPEKGVINYEELTVRPDMDGKLKDVDYGVELETYREIGEDLAKIRGDDSLIKIADDDIAKQIEKEQAYKEALNDIKPAGEND